ALGLPGHRIGVRGHLRLVGQRFPGL
ncbi:MAG: hypothetical protein AVDCRST_MAG90-1564, partial [uncultured Microvirga sp.]